MGKAARSVEQAATWEEAHQRVTFHCPKPLVAKIEREMRRSGRSKSRVIVEALAADLGGDGE